MKKILVGFVLAVGIFAGFSPNVWAEDKPKEEPVLNCFWLGVNDSLQDACKEVKIVKKDVELWIDEEDIKKINENVGAFYKENKIHDILDENDNIEEKCLLIKGNVDHLCTEELALLNKALNTYAIGLIKYYEGYGSKSEIAKEKYFREAIDYFKKAEKFARKPVIHSGGILPGPKAEDSGESYLLNKFLVKFINGSLIMLFSIGTLMLIIGGLMFLFASEEEEMKTRAKSTIFWGITGIVIAIMAYAIVKFVIGLDFGF